MFNGDFHHCQDEVLTRLQEYFKVVDSFAVHSLLNRVNCILSLSRAWHGS
jgi:hypothetical protein